MISGYEKYLVCPQCQSELTLVAKEIVEGRVQTGILKCLKCRTEYAIVGFIPRFISSDNYALSFGFEWNIHGKTQYDSASGAAISYERFFKETQWPKDLRGELLLEAGCGSGRFTEHAAATGAMVISFDLSNAVEANYRSNGHKKNVLIVQADIYHMPFARESFDRIYCLGVLQHTPDVHRSFVALSDHLKKNGSLVIDVYRKFHWLKQMFFTKYWIRPITKKIDPQKLYSIISLYIHLMWPIARCINALPMGRKINTVLLIADFRGVFNLNEEQLKEWAILDTFDMLSPQYDFPQTMRTVSNWFRNSQFAKFEVQPGHIGIEGRGTK